MKGLKKTLLLLLCLLLCISTVSPAFAATAKAELDAATDYLVEQGILTGYGNGDLGLDDFLTRAQLAALLTRVVGNQEHVDFDRAFYEGQCKRAFSDVPNWAGRYVGYCLSNRLMIGYGNGRFGSNDYVTLEAFCTVILRYLEMPETDWSYGTATVKAGALGLLPDLWPGADAISRGQMAIILYRAMTGRYGDSAGAPDLVPNTVSLPSDGSQYIPKVGDVIPCGDGTLYTVTDVRHWDNNAFSSGPLPPLPTPTCDWSSFPTVELPAPEARHFQDSSGDYLYVRNLYETRRMQYTLMNLAGTNPETSSGGKLLYGKKGTPYVRINLTIPDTAPAWFFWPWRDSELAKLFNSCPPGTYSVEAWDFYKDGVYNHTEYRIYAN